VVDHPVATHAEGRGDLGEQRPVEGTGAQRRRRRDGQRVAHPAQLDRPGTALLDDPVPGR
jgi:hypothetical protein